MLKNLFCNNAIRLLVPTCTVTNCIVGCLTVLMLCFTTTAKAQWYIGIQGGYTHNTLHSNLGNFAFAAYKPVSGFTVGVPVQYQVNNWFAVQADASFITKAYKVERSEYYKGVYQTTTNNYLQLPVMGHFIFGGKSLKGFMNLGVYAAYWTQSKAKGVQVIINQKEPFQSEGIDYALDRYYYDEYNETLPFDSRRDRRIELGFLAGTGLNYDFSNRYRAFVEARYYYGVTDLQKNYMMNQIPRYNQTVAIQAGLMFKITK